MLLNKLSSSQLAFSICNVSLEDKMHTFQTLSEPGHGNMSVVPNYLGKNWTLGTLKIIGGDLI